MNSSQSSSLFIVGGFPGMLPICCRSICLAASLSASVLLA